MRMAIGQEAELAARMLWKRTLSSDELVDMLGYDGPCSAYLRRSLRVWEPIQALIWKHDDGRSELAAWKHGPGVWLPGSPERRSDENLYEVSARLIAAEQAKEHEAPQTLVRSSDGC